MPRQVPRQLPRQCPGPIFELIEITSKNSRPIIACKLVAKCHLRGPCQQQHPVECCKIEHPPWVDPTRRQRNPLIFSSHPIYIYLAIYSHSLSNSSITTLQLLNYLFTTSSHLTGKFLSASSQSHHNSFSYPSQMPREFLASA